MLILGVDVPDREGEQEMPLTGRNWSICRHYALAALMLRMMRRMTGNGGRIIKVGGLYRIVRIDVTGKEAIQD
jgi:hypothetical protein